MGERREGRVFMLRESRPELKLPLPLLLPLTPAMDWMVRGDRLLEAFS